MKRSAFLVCLLAGAMLPMLAAAQSGDTSRPIRLVVPYSAGGGSDILTRALGQKLTDLLHRPVIVDNKPGANGYIAAEYVAKSAPDGSTLLVGGNALIVGPLLFTSHKLNVLKDFTPIGNLVRVPLVLVGSPKLPASNIRDLVRAAKAAKEPLTYASTSPGIMMATEQIKSLAGIDLLRVPYRGVPEALTDVTTDRVQLLVDSVAAELPHIKAGRVKAFAVTSSSRDPALPDVPTLAEAGLPGYVEDSYIGVLGPAGMDRQMVETINAALGKALQAADFKALLERNSFVPDPASSKTFTDMLSSTTVRFGSTAKQLGIKPE